MFKKSHIIKLQKRDKLFLSFFFVLVTLGVVVGLKLYFTPTTETVEEHAKNVGSGFKDFVEVSTKSAQEVDRVAKVVEEKTINMEKAINSKIEKLSTFFHDKYESKIDKVFNIAIPFMILCGIASLIVICCGFKYLFQL